MLLLQVEREIQYTTFPHLHLQKKGCLMSKDKINSKAAVTAICSIITFSLDFLFP